ncbi:protein archease isoform X10 [Vulpes vulpes]
MAMFGYMTDTGTVEPLQTVEVETQGDDLQSLLFHFLDEWLYKFSADEFFIPREVKVLQIDQRNFKLRSIGTGNIQEGAENDLRKLPAAHSRPLALDCSRPRPPALRDTTCALAAVATVPGRLGGPCTRAHLNKNPRPQAKTRALFSGVSQTLCTGTLSLPPIKSAVTSCWLEFDF